MNNFQACSGKEFKEKTILYVVSTPLNILVACTHALMASEAGEKQLWLVDQKITENNFYYQVLQRWIGSPFSSVQIFAGSVKGIKKLAERKQNFFKIKQLLQSFSPNYVLTGSDRRVEFQYILNILKSCAPNVVGGYLDDGLYSYQGRESVWYKDKLNSFLKKISYGFWWEEPYFVGGSSKIKQLYLFQPEQALKEIVTGKAVCQLPLQMFTDSRILALSSALLDECGEDTEGYQDIELLIFIAHPHDVEKMTGYQAKVTEFIRIQAESGINVAVKYHPIVQEYDPFLLCDAGAFKVVTSALASEFILPLLDEQCAVVGDVCTALLTCKWLRPDLSLFAVLSKQDSYQCQFITMIEGMNINVVNEFNEVVVKRVNNETN